MTRTALAFSLTALACGLLPAPAAAQTPLRKIGEMELQLAGLAAVLDPVNPVVPKNTPAGVQVIVRAGGRELTAAEVESLVGGAFFIEAELNGPGLPRTVTTPDLEGGEPLPADPLILPLPGLNAAGDYELSNVRIVSGGRAVMGVLPEVATLKVIDQVLVTRLVTRPLTLDELREKGIEITSKDYTGFQFSLALRLESEVVNLDFPVVFDRNGVVVPQPIDTTVTDPTRTVESPAAPRPPAMIVPVMLLPEGEADAGPQLPLTLPNGEPIRIPSVLVIPGNVGYLKQFFSAVVYVANGTPQGSRLFVRDIAGKIELPPGDDLAAGTGDDPLYLAKRIGEDVPPAERPVLGIGPDETPGTEDDVAAFAPGEQGQAEWVLVGNGEGFHKIDIALAATLEGLPTGPVKVKGGATGGVLVRNPFFDVTFTVPSVVRDGETFKAAITLNNIGQGDGQDVHIKLDAARMSGLQLLSDAEQSVLRIAAGEAHAFEYEFKSLRTGKVVATYLRFDPEPGANVQGRVDFTIGVTDEGVPLSPDTLVLPASVSLLPGPVSYAAMRVLGQAWSIANAPRGSLPSHVTRITRGTVEQKALALAEAGLRVTLRDADDRDAALAEALRDLALDFWGGDPVDPGFDRLLRQSGAGRAFSEALGAALGPAADAAGGAAAFERALAEVAASGPDFLSLSVVGGADVALTDSLGRRTMFERPPDGDRSSTVPGAVLLPLGPPEAAPIVGLVTEAVATGYRLDVSGPAAITLTAPKGGVFVRGTVNADGRAVLAIDLVRPEAWVLEQDMDGDGSFELQRPVAMETLEPQGPELLAAAIIGSETLPRAGDFGLNAVLVFDRPVDPARASDTSAYSLPSNTVAFAKPQLSGRLVFVTLEQPEGPNVETDVGISGLADRRGFSRDATAPLRSRLTRGGAWVSGQVREADGTPIDQGSVVYSNVSDAACAVGGLPQPLARVPLGSDGSYEIRYVRQGSCGFEVAAADPNNVLLRRLDGRVRRPGERMFLDIVLLGEGAVEGFVWDLAGQPVAGAAVAVTSETDKKRGGGAVTDATGHYRVEGLPVGLVSVKAGFGTGLGNATGRVERAGTAARVDVTLDSGAVTVSGTFSQVKDGGAPQPVAGALMSFLVTGGAAGFVFTDATGAFRFEGMPVGNFTIQARGNGPFGPATASLNGFAAAGQTIEDFTLLHVAKPDAVLGSVSGRVQMPGGAGAAGVIVAQDVSTGFIQNATGTDGDGNFVLAGLPTGVNVSIGAITTDRRRQGYAWAFIDPVTREQDGVVITLSAIGSATFTVLGPNAAPVGNQEVALLGVGGFAGVCRNPCGCRTGVTNANGVVTFADLPLGAYTAQAVRREGGFTEAATGTAVISREGEPGFGTVQLLGSGTVRGEVSLASPNATFTGGSVSLVSRSFVNDGLFTCGMLPQESHRAQVNPLTSSYEFKNVAVGAVSATGRSDLGVATNKGNLAHAGETLTLNLQFVDTIAGELSGRVFLPSGTPAGAGVEVTVNGPLPDVTVSTDADSHFVFARVLPQGNYSITARDSVTGGVVRDFVYLRTGQDLQHDLSLLGRGTVRVKVEDALGAAVDRAFVTLREQQFPQRRHDRSIEPTLLGLATFPDVFEGPFSVEVRDLVGRGGRGSGAVPAPDAAVDVTVRLNPTGNVTGSFLMPDRTTPIPYALVTLLVNGRAVGQATTPGTGDQIGRFSFDYVPAGPVRVEAEDPLTLRTGFAVGTLEAGETPLDLPVIAKGLGTAKGQVLARVAGGPDEPRPGATVKIQAGSYTGNTLADAAGHYEFGGVPEGPFTVTASIGTQALTGSASGSITLDGETVDLDVYLRDSGRVAGQVLRSDGETPAPPSKVTITAGGIGGGTQVAYTREGGLFSFEQVATGRATITAEELGGLDRGKGAVDVAIGENDGARVVLNGVGTLVVRARDASDAAVAGDVWLSGTGAFPWQEFVRVPAGGEFRLAKVLAGPVTAKLRATPGEATLWGTGAGEVRPDQENELVVTLAPSGTVVGRIRRADTGAPAYGADVTLQLSGGAGAASVQADENGDFVATGIPLVAFDLRASDPVSGGVALLRDRQIAANGETLDLGEIVLDTRAPLVTILEPADGSVQPGVGGPLVVEVADDGAGIDTSSLVVYYPSGGARGASHFSFVGGRATGTLEPSWVGVGSNTLRAYVKDLAGRVGEAVATFRVLGATINGTVHPAAGSSAAGARVAAGTVVSFADANGAFALTGLRPGSHWVVATDPQTGLSVQQLVPVTDGGEASVELQLPAFGRVTGTVRRRADLQGVPGVVVTGPLGSRAETGEAGVFVLGALPLGSYTLDATDPATGDKGRAAAVLTASGQTVDVTIDLNGIGALSVTVYRAGGGLVANADVWVASSSEFASSLHTRTGAGGEPAVFPKVFAGSLTVTATSDGLDGLTTLTLGDRQSRSVSVELEPAARIAGTVSEAISGFAVGATVRLSGVKTATTLTLDSPAGSYAFENVPLGDFTLEVETSRGDRGRATGRLLEPDTTATVPIRLNGLGRVIVRVETASGAPVNGANVTLRTSAPFPVTWPSQTVGGLVDEPDVLAGVITATVRHPVNFTTVEVSGTLVPGGELTLPVTLDPTGTIAGHVRSAGGTSAVQGAAVTIPGESVYRITDSNGAFSVSDLPLGTYTLEVRVAGRLRARVEGVELTTNGETVSREIELIVTGRVAGTVTKGSTVSGASVQLTSQATPWDGFFSTTTNASGQYAIEDVPVGTFSIVAFKGSDRAERSGTMPPAGGTVTVDLALVASVVSLPTSLKDANGSFWQVTKQAALERSQVFRPGDGTPRLSLVKGGVTLPFAGSCPASGSCFVPSEENKRELVFEQDGLHGLHVTRKVFIPADGYFVRILDLITNPNAADSVTVDLVQEAKLGSSFVRASSSGDTSATAADQWLVLDDSDTSDIWTQPFPTSEFGPTVLAAWGAGGTAPSALSVASVAGPRTLVTERWNVVTLLPGETRAVLHFVAVQSDQRRAGETGKRLVRLPPEALAGLTPQEALAVLNFDVPDDLVTPVEALPPNDGVVDSVSYSGDRVLTFRPTTASFRSQSDFFGQPLSFFSGIDFTRIVADPAAGKVVPRAPFTITVTRTSPLGDLQRVEAGDFPPEGPARRDVVFEGAGTLTGRVVRSDGSAIRGGSVDLSNGSQFERLALGAGSNEFVFGPVPAGTYVLTSNHPLTSHQVSVTGVVLPGTCTTPAAGLTCERVARDIVYPELGAVDGVVKTAADFPIRARLELIAGGFSRSLNSDAVTGLFQFVDVPPGSYTLRATDNTRSNGVVSVPVVVTAGADTAVPVTLLPVGTAQVTARSGLSPLASGQVQWQSDARGPAFVSVGSTNGSGAATVPNVVGDPFRIRVHHPSNYSVYGEAEGRITAEAEIAPVSVTVPELGTISGVLRSRAGTGVPSAYVYAMNVARDDYYWYDFSDASGAFTLDGVPQGSIFLRGEIGSGSPALWSVWDEPLVLSSDTLSADAHVPVGDLGPRETHVWELDVPAGTTLSGGVQGWAHAGYPPLASYLVEIFGPDGHLEGSAGGAGAAYGSRTLTNVTGGTWLVAARSTSDVAGGYRVGSTIRDAVHVFRPYAGGIVEVAVRRDALVVTGLSITVGNSRTDLPVNERSRTGVTDAEGGYRVPMRPGPITARVVDPLTGDTREASGELAADGTLRLTIELEPRPTTLFGRVTNGDGSTGLPAYLELYRSGSWVTDTNAGPTGEYRFDPLPPDTYTLRAWFVGPPVATTITLTGGTFEQNLAMPISVVRGLVLEPPPVNGGAPDVLVELCFDGGCHSTTSDANGAFVFYGAEGSPPASLRATTRDGSNLATSAAIPWSEGFTGTVVQDLVLPASASLLVTVNAPGGGSPAEGATVEVYRDGLYGPLQLRAGVTDANGQVRFRHFTSVERVRLYAEQGDEVGQGFADVAIGEERPVTITLAESGWLDVGIEDENGLVGGAVAVQAIEQSSRSGGVWTRFEYLDGEGGPETRTLRIPVGAFRVVFDEGVETAGVVEGVLAAGETRSVRVRPGTHVRLPLPLPGDQALFVGENPCPPPCSGFARSRLPGAEEYPPFGSQELDGRSLRSLRVAGYGARVRRLQYAPRSGAFGRTLTLVTNAGGAPVTIPLDTVLGLDTTPGAVVASGGAVDASATWVLVSHATGIQGLVVGGALAPETLRLVDDGESQPRLEARHVLSVGPDETLALLSFTLVGTGGDTAPLEARAAALASLAEPGALFGLTNEERDAIANFALPPAGDLRVTVSFGADPVEGATVGVLDGAQAVVARSTTSSQGTALFAGLAPGTYTIVAVDGFGRPGRAVVDVTAGTTAADTVAAAIELLADEALGSVDLTAAWSGTGDGAPGVRVALEAAGWSPVWRPFGETDAAGAVGFTRVPTATLAVRPDPASVGASAAVEVTAGAASPASLPLDPFATLQGQVLAGDAATPLPRAPVAAIDAVSGDVLAAGETDDSGWYRLDGLRPGPGGLLIRAASPYDAAVTVESEILTPAVPGSTSVPALALAVGVIDGQVQTAYSSVRYPAVVARDSSGRSIVAGWTNEWGSFRILGAAGGPVTVIAVDPETGERTSESLELDPAVPASLWLFLGPPGE